MSEMSLHLLPPDDEPADFAVACLAWGVGLAVIACVVVAVLAAVS